MALPEGFSDWEHLQSTLMSVYNRRVREEFSDLGDDWDPDITTPRGSLRVACTLKDSDSAPMSLIRMWIFYTILGQASAMHPPLYTMPTDRYQQEVKFAPQVTLYFREDADDVEEGYSPIDAEVSFRLMNESPQTFTPAEALPIANRIRTEFASGSGFRWRKGRTKLCYKNLEQGYFLLINAYNEAEGRILIDKVLDIQGHSLDADKLTISQLASTPPIVPPTQTIYGRSRRLPRRRPVGHVRFIYADLHLWGMPNAVCLVDRSGRRRNPIVAA